VAARPRPTHAGRHGTGGVVRGTCDPIRQAAYAAAWMSLVCHLLSLLFFFCGSMLSPERFRSTEWWMRYLITTGSLAAAVWSFEVD